MEIVEFINTYGRILKDGKCHPFTLYPFQEYVMEEFEEHDSNIILKSRGMGVTNMLVFKALHTALFNSNQYILYMSVNSITATLFMDKIRLAYDALPGELKPNIKEHTKNKIIFENDSVIVVSGSDITAGCSSELTMFIADEVSFIKDFENIWTAVQPTLYNSIAKNGKVIFSSTANGSDDYFAKLWKKTIKTETRFNPIKLTWLVHPEFRKMKEYKKIFGHFNFNIEMECEFV